MASKGHRPEEILLPNGGCGVQEGSVGVSLLLKELLGWLLHTCEQ